MNTCKQENNKKDEIGQNYKLSTKTRAGISTVALKNRPADFGKPKFQLVFSFENRSDLVGSL